MAASSHFCNEGVPVQVPANLGVGRLCGDEVVCRFVEPSELSLATLAVLVRFGFGFADCPSAGVGLSGTSEIGAGSRSAEIKSMARQSQRPIPFIVGRCQAFAKTR
jgi:hypothetical protein